MSAQELHESLRSTAAAAIEGIRLIRTARKAPMLRLALATELAQALGLLLVAVEDEAAGVEARGDNEVARTFGR